MATEILELWCCFGVFTYWPQIKFAYTFSTIVYFYMLILLINDEHVFPTDINTKNNKALTLLNLFIPSLLEGICTTSKSWFQAFYLALKCLSKAFKKFIDITKFWNIQGFESYFLSSYWTCKRWGCNENWELRCMKPLVMLIWEILFEKPIRNQFNFLLKVKKINKYIKCIDSKNKGTMSLRSTLLYLLYYWYHIKHFQKHG